MAALPEELLQQVFSQQPVSSDLSTMANISLANRTCYRVVKPHLYHTLSLGHCSQTRRRRDLLQTLLQNPDTGTLVRSFYVEGWEMEPTFLLPEVWRPEPMPHDLMSDALVAVDGAGLPISLRDPFRLQLAGGVEDAPDAEIALLLLLIPNMRFLAISLVYYMQESLFMCMIQHRPLHQLSEVNVEHWDTEDSSSMDGLVALLQLPALDTFRGRAIDCNAESSTLLAPVHSTLKRVFLYMSLLDDGGLQNLLLACPDLETLSVHWGPETIGETSIDYSAIGQALREHGHKLKSLHLTPEDVDFPEDMDINSPLGSLTELTALRFLDVTYHALCAAKDTSPDHLRRILPHSLRTLRIDAKDASSGEDDKEADETNHFDLQLLEIMRDEHFGDLSTITVERGGTFTLSEEAKAAGWNDDESGESGSVLKRQGRQDGDRTG
ncbi:hypothetical protein LTR15_008670 [Elasticomyces elasticus]|nr:hypothetical protein LTR15_008670 [Elasticomyces elasticus]